MVPISVAAALLISIKSIASVYVIKNHTPNCDRPMSRLESGMARTLESVTIGSLGPKATSRRRYRYYDTLFFMALQYGADAQSIIEVGCASDPFIQHLHWINEKTCVAPYFVNYGDQESKNDNRTNVKMITADFVEYEIADKTKYDLLVCSQVLEHVPSPALFLRKLISSARTSIISVPFNWDDCGSKCNHVTHKITREMLLEWSAPHEPIHSGIVMEDSDYKKNKGRIILVYKHQG